MSDLFQLDQDLPPVTIVRRKRQRTMRIRIKTGSITVSGPASVSKGRLMDFVREKSGWIRKAVERRRLKSEQLKSIQEANKGTILLRGERKNIYPFPVPGLRKPRLIEHAKALVFQYNPAVTGDNDGEITPEIDILHDFYLKIAKSELPKRFDYWVDRLPFKPRKLSIRNQKTKWGSCSSRGTISLNWRLIKCPDTIVNYIIIHELCHLKHFNHSNDFWQTVAHHYPETDKARTWIRKHSDEIFLDT